MSLRGEGRSEKGEVIKKKIHKMKNEKRGWIQGKFKLKGPARRTQIIKAKDCFYYFWEIAFQTPKKVCHKGFLEVYA
jgi:hypothetical protein